MGFPNMFVKSFYSLWLYLVFVKLYGIYEFDGLQKKKIQIEIRNIALKTSKLTIIIIIEIKRHIT